MRFIHIAPAALLAVGAAGQTLRIALAGDATELTEAQRDALDDFNEGRDLEVEFVSSEFNSIDGAVQGEADLVNIDGVDAVAAFLAEEALLVGFENEGSYTATPVVRVNSDIQSFADMRDRNACHTGTFKSAGTFMPLGYAVENSEITNIVQMYTGDHYDGCESPVIETARNYFRDICMPANSPGWPGYCGLCPGDCDNTSEYSGYKGALKGLVDNICDVAFVKSTTVADYCAKIDNCDNDDYRSITLKNADGSDADMTVPSHSLLVLPSLNIDIEEVKTTIRELVADDVLKPAVTEADAVTVDGTTTEEHIGSYAEKLESVPGFSEFLECTKAGPNECPEVETDCTYDTATPFLRIGLPEDLWERRAQIQTYLNTQATDDERIVLARTDSIYRLNDNSVDSIDLDSGAAAIGSLRFEQQVSVVEVDDGAQNYVASALVRSDSGLSTFSDLRGKKSCHTGFLKTAGMQMPVGWSVQNRHKTGMKATLVTGYGIDQCRSPLLYTVRDYFGASCAPPTTAGHVGICDLCYSGAEAEGAAGESVCDSGNRYAGYNGALRGLIEGACDVAFVRSTTFNDACGANDSPAWCDGAPDIEELAEIQEAGGFAKVPTHPIMVRNNAPEQAVRIASLLTTAEAATAFDKTFDYVDGVDESQVGTKAATDAHLESYVENVQNVPGMLSLLNCEALDECTPDVDTDCPATPLAVQMHFALGDDPYRTNASALITAFKNVNENRNTNIVGLDAGSANELEGNTVDVAFLDASEGTYAWLNYGSLIIGNEVRNDGTDAYKAFPWVRKDSGIKTYSQLEGKKSCHTGLLKSAGSFMPVGYGIRAGHIDPSVIDAQLDACTSPLIDTIRRYFGESCAPPASEGEAGICDLCDPDTPCDSNNRYAGYDGAFQGLVDGVCDVAFVRQKTPDEYCGIDADPGNKPEFCDANLDDFEMLEELQRTVTGLGTVPEHAFYVRNDLSDAFIGHAQALLIEPSFATSVRRNLNLARFTPVENVNSETTRAYLGTYAQNMELIPGGLEFLSCSENNSCAPAETNCPNNRDFIVLSLVQDSDCGGKPCITASALNEVFETEEYLLPDNGGQIVVTQKDGAATPTTAVDVISNDAAVAYLFWKGNGYQAIGVAEATGGQPSYVATAWVRTDSGLTTFDQLQGKTSCHTGMFKSAGMFMPVGWAAQNSNAFKSVMESTDELSNPITACNSGLRMTLYNFFDASCAVPVQEFASGICDACFGNASAGDEASCTSANRYAGYDGALRGLMEGACDVAFVRESSFDDYCTGDNAADWCRSNVKVLDELSNGGFGDVPGHPLMVSAALASTPVGQQVTDRIMALQSDDNVDQDTLGELKVFSSEQAGEEAYTESILGEYGANVENVPGVKEDELCRIGEGEPDCSTALEGECDNYLADGIDNGNSGGGTGSDSDGLSDGAIAGIVIVVLVGVAAIAGIVFWAMRRARANRKYENHTDDVEMTPSTHSSMSKPNNVYKYSEDSLPHVEHAARDAGSSGSPTYAFTIDDQPTNGAERL
eukprot:Clim_evm17s1 gene=Clim_evmTU17s1